MKNQRQEMRVSPELIKAVDGWRGKQLDVPNRCEAYRRLIVFGLKTETRLPAPIKRWAKAQLDTSGHRETVPTDIDVAAFLLSLED